MSGRDNESSVEYVFSNNVLEKLKIKHSVTVKEVKECFNNHTDRTLKDNSEKHATTPATWWFIAETNTGRRLKVCFMLFSGEIHIKTAYEANNKAEALYVSKTTNNI